MILRSEALSALPGLSHGFFTRQGGVSEGVWSSLNVGLRSGDAPDRVAENRSRAAAALGGTPAHLVTARQVHGTLALAVAGPWDNRTAPEADAIVTDRPGLILGVLTADCGPVLLADPEAAVVGAVHAGWKGALGGVLESALAAMARLGADPRRVAAVLGPCIARASYEVGPEFVARFTAEDGASGGYFAAGSSKARFDLPGYIAARLRRAGVERVEVLGHDTCADESRFFSFRRTTQRGEQGFGLQLSAIALRE